LDYGSWYEHNIPKYKLTLTRARSFLEPEKGSSFYTNKFMRGYNDGYDACSDSDGSSTNTSDRDSEDDDSTSGKGTFKVEITFINGDDKPGHARVYIQEYPHYDITPDLIDAFYNDDPYTGIWKEELVMPSGLIENSETFHVCIDDITRNVYENKDSDVTLACYEVENSARKGPKRLTIDFNNFP
jgi:hypothetical protein